MDITEKARGSLSVLKDEARRHGDVVAVSASKANPIYWEPEAQVYLEGAGQDESITMNVYGVDYGFIEMLNIPMALGRGFSREFNDEGRFIINELALEQLQWDDPVGKQLTFGDREGTVIGVAKNFHFKPIVMATLSPAILYLESMELNQLLVKYSGEEKEDDVAAFLEQRWRTVVPDQPFEYTTLDDFFEDVYISGDKTSEMTGVLGGMAIILSCMGLLGLSAFSVERRIKEIGIRKVLGASVSGVVGRWVKGFLKLVVISDLIAIPIAIFFMIQLNRFLYTYPVKIKADIFVFTILLSILVAFLTVMSQTLKAAKSNPVDSLQYE